MFGFTPYELAVIGVVGLAALAVLLMGISNALSARTGLPSNARVVASDTGQNRVVELFDEKTLLNGQPDYILEERVGLFKKLVPAELKPSRESDFLYESDEMQIVVYLIVMRANYGRRAARYGWVRYAKKSFRVDLTNERVRRCLAYRDKILAAREASAVDRTHDQRGRCFNCSFKALCDQSLV